MKFIFPLLFLFLKADLHAQQINWRQTFNWKIYDNHNIRGFTVPADKILDLKSLDLNQDSLRVYLDALLLFKPAENPVWMGGFILSFQTAGGAVKIIYASNYGGYLFIPEEKAYYLIPEDKMTDWTAYLSSFKEILKAVHEK
jgi:hypothetical protein